MGVVRIPRDSPMVPFLMVFGVIGIIFYIFKYMIKCIKCCTEDNQISQQNDFD
jgi:hypothetical protein